MTDHPISGKPYCVHGIDRDELLCPTCDAQKEADMQFVINVYTDGSDPDAPWRWDVSKNGIMLSDGREDMLDNALEEVCQCLQSKGPLTPKVWP